MNEAITWLPFCFRIISGYFHVQSKLIAERFVFYKQQEGMMENNFIELETEKIDFRG